MELHVAKHHAAQQDESDRRVAAPLDGGQGLSSDEARRRLQQYGPNALQEHKVNPLLKFLGYFWGPIPWMIEVAAVLSAVVGHWVDLGIILVLLVFNATVGFWQEYQAGNAIAQLKKNLALRARVLRDGHWQEIPARELVPGDCLRLRLGDVVPADVRLAQTGYLSIDQAALTGESLPVDKKAGDTAYSGSVVKQGEMIGEVTATGMQTYFGKTAGLVSAAKTVSHFQQAVLTIGDYLIYLALGLVVVLILLGLERQLPLMELAQFALILTVASIPVAMPAVLSVTMAVGAVALARMKAIVSRLESIEEMAGMDVLCSDKTGTLTQNRLTLGEPVLFGAADAQELILAATLASKAEDRDAIDLAVMEGLEDERVLAPYRQLDFTPFDPVSKRTEALIKDDQDREFRVSKGAPQVLLQLCRLEAAVRARAEQAVDELATKGFRTLGVARQDAGAGWRLLGILSLFDPPREDAAETIEQARAHGIRIKMVTGDNLAIAKEIAGRLGLGTRILPAEQLGPEAERSPESGPLMEQSDGFAQVFPEHKFTLVKALQARGHLVGMTGDGVNDAPALKQAEVGIAVSGATDAARAAADLVLTEPGLSVIVRAVEEARRIFQRMNAYAIYRITETIRIMIFMVLAILAYNFYPITAIMIILLALLNDLPIMTIAKDRTWLDPQPVRWHMRQVLTVASVLGGIGMVETFLLLIIARSWFGLGLAELQTVIFLKLAVAGHLTLMVARTNRAFFASPRPAPILLGAILGTQGLAVLIAGLGWFVTPIPWSYVGLVWLYCLIWLPIEDLAKLGIYRHIRMETARHRRFLGTLKGSLYRHGEAPAEEAAIERLWEKAGAPALQTGHRRYPEPTGYETRFRRRLWVCLLLSLPVWLYGTALSDRLGLAMPEIPLDWLTPVIQTWLGLPMPGLSANAWVAPLFASLLFVYAGIPLWGLAGEELRRHRPGIMVLLALASLAAAAYALAILAMQAPSAWLWLGVAVMDVLLLGLWTGMRSLHRAIDDLARVAGLLPDSVQRITEAGTAEEVAIGDVHEGDLVLMRLAQRPASYAQASSQGKGGRRPGG